MDIVLHMADDFVVDPFIIPPESVLSDESFFHREHIVRQSTTLWFIMTFGAFVMYLLFATLSYYTLWDRTMEDHAKFLPNQVRKEMTLSLTSMPIMAAFTIPILLAEVRGYSQLYDNWDDYGLPYYILSLFLFLVFTDFGIYWIHRWLHLPWLYKNVHKPHHRWLLPTPFASHAFHPIDGFSQSVPYHIFVFCFPMHKWAYLGMFVFVNFWTISIHDGNFSVPRMFRWIMNGAAHHTDHHLYFSYNYGQYFTVWDRIGGSHREPKVYTTGRKPWRADDENSDGNNVEVKRRVTRSGNNKKKAA
eukprot:TRINITY_DN7055_c0_g1_i1.p1 TRINITY_DN7055_c0_g1~~TRINITY_DN7055_c0_g1_i1.p1  ORF type:complete len:303 (-),score=78.34 TRINITY_DN7055_c0_g1_i1:100-1008(-)